jgi:hypothetical protein
MSPSGAYGCDRAYFQVKASFSRWVLRNFNHSLILESLDIPKYEIACKLRVLGLNL